MCSISKQEVDVMHVKEEIIPGRDLSLSKQTSERFQEPKSTEDFFPSIHFIPKHLELDASLEKLAKL